MRKMWLFGMSMVLLLTGCNAHQTKQENTVATADSEEVADYNLPIDKEEKEEIEDTCLSLSDTYETIYQAADKGDESNVMIDEKSENKIFESLCKGDTAVMCRDLPVNMKNEEGVQKFLADAKSGKAGETVIIEVNQNGGLSYLKFTFDGEDMILTSASLTWNEEDTAIVSYMAKCKIVQWDYTENGWFCYELSVPQTDDIMNGNQFIRVDPLSEECLSYCEKYIAPIGYQGNNLFLCDWDETDMSKVDFPALFEYFYLLKNGTTVDTENYANGIKQKEYEDVITTYLSVSPETLEEMDFYHADKKTYDWSKLGCGNYAPQSYGEPEPEVVKVTKNDDGTVTLLINAVWEGLGIDKAFTNELTIREGKGGKVTYLSNHILEDKNNTLPEYSNRLK